jgi:hypothetical protein
MVVIPADKVVKRMELNKPYTYPINGWFVPDARMVEIMEYLEREAVKTNKTSQAVTNP